MCKIGNRTRSLVNGELFPDDRIATTCVLMVWGAYIEAAASMGHTAWLLLRNPEAAAKVRGEEGWGWERLCFSRSSVAAESESYFHDAPYMQ